MLLNYRDPNWPRRLRILEIISCMAILILGILLLILDPKLSLTCIMLLLIFGTAFGFICFYSFFSIDTQGSKEQRVWGIVVAAGICAFFITAGIILNPVKTNYAPVLLLLAFSAATVGGVIFFLDFILTLRLIYLGIYSKPEDIPPERQILPTRTPAQIRFQETQTTSSIIVCPTCKQPCSKPIHECKLEKVEEFLETQVEAYKLEAMPERCRYGNATDRCVVCKQRTSDQQECSGMVCFSKQVQAEAENIDEECGCRTCTPRGSLRDSVDGKTVRKKCSKGICTEAECTKKRVYGRLIPSPKVAPMSSSPRRVSLDESNNDGTNQHGKRRSDSTGDDGVPLQKRRDVYQTSAAIRRTPPTSIDRGRMTDNLESSQRRFAQSHNVQLENSTSRSNASRSGQDSPQELYRKKIRASFEESEIMKQSSEDASADRYDKALQISSIAECRNYTCKARRDKSVDRDIQTDTTPVPTCSEQRRKSSTETPLLIEEIIEVPDRDFLVAEARKLSISCQQRRKSSTEDHLPEDHEREFPVKEARKCSMDDPQILRTPLTLDKSISSQTYDAEISSRKPFIILVKECENPICIAEKCDVPSQNLGAVKKRTSLSHPGSSKEKESPCTVRRLSNSLQTSPERRYKRSSIPQPEICSERRKSSQNSNDISGKRTSLPKYDTNYQTKRRESSKENVDKTEYYELQPVDSDHCYETVIPYAMPSSDEPDMTMACTMEHLSDPHQHTDTCGACFCKRREESPDIIRPSQIPNNILATNQPYINVRKRNGLDDDHPIVRQASPVFNYVRPLPRQSNSPRTSNPNVIMPCSTTLRMSNSSVPTTARKKDFPTQRKRASLSDPYRTNT